MGSLVYVGLAIAVPVVIGLAIAWRGRRAPSMRSGIHEFRKRLDALDPANDPLARSPRHSSGTNRSGGSDSEPESLAKDGRSG